MSYDIYLTERISGEIIELPIRHVMIGGTYKADYDEVTRTFTPAATKEAWLNITYNYSNYYYEACRDDVRFYNAGRCKGIRGIYGKTGRESIQMLKDMISRIETKYKNDGDWITSRKENSEVYEGPNRDYWTATAANAVKPLYQLLVFAELRPDGIWDGD